MNMQFLKSKIPYPIKKKLSFIYKIVPLPIRYGRVFRETYDFLQKTQWWSREKLAEYQIQEMKKLLNHAYENVPYYRRIFDERGIRPKHIQNFDDLKKLPYLTKDIIRNNIKDLIARNYPESKLEYVTTGGSSGTPMGLYWEKDVTSPKEWAFVWRQWNWAGYGFNEGEVIMRGDVINRLKGGKPQWWDYHAKDNALILSPYDMSEQNLFNYVEKINKFKPKVIRGYASNLYILSDFLRCQNLKIKNIKAIITSSETLYPYQREIIEEYLEAKIFDHYGNTERNALVMQCEKSKYHIIPEYGIIELIGNDGVTVNEEGERGEFIATGFNNYAMPFIRYKTGDIGVYSTEKCNCERNYPVLKKIDGRLQDLVVTKDKRLITLTALIFAQHFEAFSKVKEMQLFQEKEGELLVKIVRSSQYSDKDELEILTKMQRAVGSGLDIDFLYVNEIARTRRGKYKFLIQKLPIKFGE